MYVELSSSDLRFASSTTSRSLSLSDMLLSSSLVKSNDKLWFAIFECGCNSGGVISLDFRLDVVEFSSSDDNSAADD